VNPILGFNKPLALFALIFLFSASPSHGDTSYSWLVFNIPPFGSMHGEGIGFELANAYIKADLKNAIIIVNPARWQQEMLDSSNEKFCATGSWKLPNTQHRVYSQSIMNTVDYGVAVTPDLYEKISNHGETRVVSIIDVIQSTKTAGHMVKLDGRPVFGKMNTLITQGQQQEGIKIDDMVAPEGPISMLKVANHTKRNVGSVLIFPEEFEIFSKENPDHSLEYLMLHEGTSFAPIRASCPNTKEGRLIIKKINALLNKGLRKRIFQSFLNALPNIYEIREQAKLNQACIKDNSCKDPLID